MHKKEKPHRCTLCQCAFSQRGNLKAHILKVHVPPGENEKVFKCAECCCVYRRLATLNSHIAKVHAVATTTAENEAAFKNVDSGGGSLEQPEVVEAQTSILTADSSNQNVLSSAAVHSKSADTSTISALTMPQASATAPVVAANEAQAVSPQRADSGSSLLVDRSISEVKILHTDSGTLRTCPMKVKTVGQVKWHLCQYCQKGFRKPSDLIRHIRVHTQEKPYSCGVCGKSFAVKSTLKTHSKIHNPTQDLECRVCHKKFSMLSSMKSHERLHTGIKPFTCMQCGKTFRTSSQRRVHAKMHTRAVHGLSGKRKLLRIGEASTNVELSSPLKITSEGIEKT